MTVSHLRATAPETLASRIDRARTELETLALEQIDDTIAKLEASLTALRLTAGGVGPYRIRARATQIADYQARELLGLRSMRGDL